MIGIHQLKQAVKYARNVGYLLHDIRNPDFYSVDQSEQIRVLDKAFMDAANVLRMPFEQFAGFGESDLAFAMSDILADALIEDNANEVKFKSVDIYSVSLPYFKVEMKKWMRDLNDNKLQQLKDYWVRYAN